MHWLHLFLGTFINGGLRGGCVQRQGERAGGRLLKQRRQESTAAGAGRSFCQPAAVSLHLGGSRAEQKPTKPMVVSELFTIQF